jgi:phage repressor protein C with HTH and peptisase S24 domain
VKKESKVRGRVKIFLTSVEKSERLFENEIGLSNGFVSNIGDSIREASKEKILNKYPQLNWDWVLTGNGPMLKSEMQDAHVSISKTTAINEICLYDVSAAGGYGSFDEIISQEKIVGRYVVPSFRDISWMIYVKGSSMYPKYSSGDIIACRVLYESKFIQWGKVYVVATREQGILVKRLEESEQTEHIKAISDNKMYKPFDIPKNEILGIALVVGVIRLE